MATTEGDGREEISRPEHVDGAAVSRTEPSSSSSSSEIKDEDQDQDEDEAADEAADGIELRTWRTYAILAPWIVVAATTSAGGVGFGKVWLAGFLIGAVPIVPAVWSLRRERNDRGTKASGLEGLGWTYLVIAAFAAVLSLPVWFWPE